MKIKSMLLRMHQKISVPYYFIIPFRCRLRLFILYTKLKCALIQTKLFCIKRDTNLYQSLSDHFLENQLVICKKIERSTNFIKTENFYKTKVYHPPPPILPTFCFTLTPSHVRVSNIQDSNPHQSSVWWVP